MSATKKSAPMEVKHPLNRVRPTSGKLFEKAAQQIYLLCVYLDFYFRN